MIASPEASNRDRECKLYEPHPFFKAIIDSYRASGRPAYREVGPVEGRAMLRAAALAATSSIDAVSLASIENRSIDGPHGAIPLRLYRPIESARGVIVYFHSGGWVIGDLDTADATCRRLSALTKCCLISVEYRLAPEHSFPQPLDDAYAALLWASKLSLGPMVVAGESSGGNLAAACAIRARQGAGPRLVGQWLAYPVTDHDFSTGSYRQVGDRNWLLSTADMRWFWDQYCPAGVDRDNPEISPLRLADLRGLPPAMVLVGELDPLRDEGWSYATRLAAAGVAVTARCDAGMVHGYLGAAGAVPTAASAMQSSASWIRAQIDQLTR